MRQRAMIWCATCVIVLCAGSAAVAEPVYQFAFDQSDYLVVPGGAVNVIVYLKETVGSGTSVLDSNGLGMFGAGVVLTDITPLPTNPAIVLAEADIAHNALFDDTGSQTKLVTTTPPISATLVEAVADPFSPVHADNPTPGQATYFLTIGTFKFTAGSAPGEVTYVQTGPNPLGDVNITGPDAEFEFVSLDSLIANGSCTITTTPEPSALALSGMAALAILALRCWNRRRGAVTACHCGFLTQRSSRCAERVGRRQRAF